MNITSRGPLINYLCKGPGNNLTIWFLYLLKAQLLIKELIYSDTALLLTLSKRDESVALLVMERELSGVKIPSPSSKFELILRSPIHSSLLIYAYNTSFFLAYSALQFFCLAKSCELVLTTEVGYSISHNVLQQVLTQEKLCVCV